MRLLTRYLLRQLVAPFCFALAALTGFMLLNQVAKKFGNLVGKGLPWHVIGEVFALSIPFIVAMTLPMAVLVAVLFAVTRLAADNEITAMRACGVGVGRLLTPLLVWGALMAAVNFLFVDQVLPRSNARLRNLYVDINRKKPTFALREQVINEVPPSQFFLRAGRIEPGTGRLRDVTIFDVSDQTSRRVIYADSGVMGFAPGGTDLSLRLYHGSVHQVRTAEPDLFQLSYFAINEIRIKDVFDRLQRNNELNNRGDREMSTCEMLAVIDSARTDEAQAVRDRESFLQSDLRALLHLPARPPPAHSDTAVRLPAYCGWLRRATETLLPRTAEAEAPAQARTPAATPVPAPPPPIEARHVTSWAEVVAARDRESGADRRADGFAVEVHKKWAISFACISFVIVGLAMALRFPRGGIGLVIGGGFFVFAIYYIGLTAGESLADRALVSPALAMWLPNILFFTFGGIGLIRVARESGSTRGGDLTELADALRAAPGWWRRRVRAR